MPSSYIRFRPVVDNAMVTETESSVEDAVFLLLQCRLCDGDYTRSVEDAVPLLLQCCFMSTETGGIISNEEPRSPLSHSS